MGASGSYRQQTLSRRDLTMMQKHEERADEIGLKRSVDNVPPLVWSDGQISEPDGWSPGAWQSSLVADYEAHVSGAKYKKGSDKIAVHAFLQFPTDLEVNEDNEKLMLQSSVEFVNKMNGGDAVFHARLDRDEQGKHGVDVFFAPKYEKITGKKKDIVQKWVSLTKFQKELAESKGLGNDHHARGAMFQDEFAEHLRGMGLDWVTRGKKKLSRDNDRLEPEVYKFERDKEQFEETVNKFRRIKALFEEDQRDVLEELERKQKEADFRLNRAKEIEKNLSEREKSAVEKENKFSCLNKKYENLVNGIEESLNLCADGSIRGVRSAFTGEDTPENRIYIVNYSDEFKKEHGISYLQDKYGESLFKKIAQFIKPVFDVAAEINATVQERLAATRKALKRSRNDGLSI